MVIIIDSMLEHCKDHDPLSWACAWFFLRKEERTCISSPWPPRPPITTAHPSMRISEG